MEDENELNRLVQLRELEIQIEDAFHYRSLEPRRKEIYEWDDEIINLQEEYKILAGDYYNID